MENNNVPQEELKTEVVEKNSKVRVAWIISLLVVILFIPFLIFSIISNKETEGNMAAKGFVYYEDRQAGFSFEYPIEWGEVIVEEYKVYYDIQSLRLYKFSGNENIEIKSYSSGVISIPETTINTYPYVGSNELFDFCMEKQRSYNYGSPDSTYFNVSEGCDTSPIGLEKVKILKYEGEGSDEKRMSTLNKYYNWKLTGENYNNLSVVINNIDVFVNNRHNKGGGVRFYPEEDRQLIKEKYQDFYVSSEGVKILDFVNSFNIFEKDDLELVDTDFTFKECSIFDKDYECSLDVGDKKFYLKEDLGAESRRGKYEIRSSYQGQDTLLWDDVSHGEVGIFKKDNDSKYLLWNDGEFGKGCGNSGMRTYVINTENLSSYRIENTSGGYILIDAKGDNEYSTSIKLGVSKEGEALDVINWEGYPFDNETHIYVTDSILMNNKKVFEFPKPALFEWNWSGGELWCSYDSSIEIRNVKIKDGVITFSVTNNQDDVLRLDFMFNLEKNKLMDSEGNVLNEVEEIPEVIIANDVFVFGSREAEESGQVLTNEQKEMRDSIENTYNNVAVEKYVEKFNEVATIIETGDAVKFKDYLSRNFDELLRRGLITQDEYNSFVDEMSTTSDSEVKVVMSLMSSFGIKKTLGLPKDKFISITEEQIFTEDGNKVVVEIKTEGEPSEGLESSTSTVSITFIVDPLDGAIFYYE